MGFWSDLLHPRQTGGRFATKPKPYSGGRSVGIPQLPGAGGGGGRGHGRGRGHSKKPSGPPHSDLTAVGQVMSGNIVTTDGGRTWSVLGSKTPGTATRTVQRAIHDGLLAPPSKGGHTPTVTRLGATDYRQAGLKPPPARAPILAQQAARRAATALRQRQAAQRAAARQTQHHQTAVAQATASLHPTPPVPPPNTANRGVRSTVSSRNRGR